MEKISECRELSLNLIGEVIAHINLLLWTCGLLIFELLGQNMVGDFVNSKLTKSVKVAVCNGFISASVKIRFFCFSIAKRKKKPRHLSYCN